MQKILQAIQSANANVDRRFTDFQIQLRDLRSGVASMKLEMMTRPEFEQLESRVYTLESNVVSTDNPDVRFLQEQLDRLDPANKCISVIGFKGMDAVARTKLLEAFIKVKFPLLLRVVPSSIFSRGGGMRGNLLG